MTEKLQKKRAVPVSELRRLRELFDAYQKTSDNCCEVARLGRDKREAYGRACESAVLGVVVAELDKLISEEPHE